MDFDVVIIGASSAGLFAAELLARQGKQVALFEETEPIDPDSRLYIITPGIYRVVPDLDPALIRQRIEKIEIQSVAEQKGIELSSHDLVIDRRDLILYLVDRSQRAGVKFFYNGKFLGFGSDQDGAFLRIDHHGDELSVRTKHLIAADGINSAVRMSMMSAPIQSVPLLQAEVDLSPDWDSSITKVWFNPETTPYFFWLIPDGDQSAVVGLISDPGRDIRGLLDEFLTSNGFVAKSYQAGKAAIHDGELDVEGLVGGIQILYVGEAAGQVKVTTVGGTVTGFAGAKAAAEAILEKTPYQKRLRAVQRELNLHRFIRSLLDQMTSADYQRMIRLLNLPVINLLSTIDRDQMRTNFWKLAILQPAFIPLGIKLFLRFIFR